MSNSLSLSCRNRLDDLPSIAAPVLAFLDEHHVPPDARTTLQLALEELLTNILRHGYEQDQDGEIRLELETHPDRLAVAIADEGRPFDPLALPAPDLEAPLEQRREGGLGVHLVRSTVSRMSYARQDETNVLRFEIDY